MLRARVPRIALAGGTTYNGTITENVAASDSYSATAAYNASLSESVSAGDSYTASVIYSAPLSESVSAGDSYTASVIYNAPLSESVSAGDSYTASVIYNALLSESVAASDSYTSSAIYNASLSESVAASDSYTSSAIYNALLAESVSANDLYEATGGVVVLPPREFPAYQPAPLLSFNEAQHRQQIAFVANTALSGKMNAVTEVTLTPHENNTTIVDARISKYSFIALYPLTENAAAAVSTTYIPIATQLNGSAIIQHAHHASTDRTFSVLIIG